MSFRIGLIQKRILILLFGSLALGVSYTPRQRSRAFAQIGKEWSSVKTESLRRAIQELYQNKMISIKESSDGIVTLKLSDQGRKKVLEYNLEEIKITKPSKWDGKWRMVLFDIPSSKKKIREAFRRHLGRIGLYQYQKSVFIHPYECDNEIDFLIEFYGIRKYVRKLVVSAADDDLNMRSIFNDRFGAL